MPQANDAEYTEAYTSAPGLDVEDNEPNTGAPGGQPTNNFELHVELVAGNVIGNGGGNYRMEITCIDETLAAPNNAMSPGVLNQQFLAADGWLAGGPAGNFHKEQVFNINVDPNARGHVLSYVATLVSAGRDVVSFIRSNRFILV
jgi:hypothetical protein